MIGTPKASAESTGMLMQNLVLVVQNTTEVKNLGVATSAVTFFRSLGGTVGVAVMGSILGTVVADSIKDGIGGLPPEQQLEAAQTLAGGGIPQISQLPDFLRVVVESAYGMGVGTVFLAAVPLAIVTLIEVIFLPYAPLGTQNAIQRAKGAEAGTAGAAAGSADVEDVLSRELEDAADAAIDAAAASFQTARTRTKSSRSCSSTEAISSSVAVLATVAAVAVMR